jgi:L-ascorbate metabolism protein UlaG (beta-lactamase superfamily)
MRITWFGHSTFRLEFGSSVVLIDPFFTGNPAFEGGDRGKAVAGATHIVITHGHGDHVGDTLEVAAETGAKVITNFDLCMWLASKGLKNFDPMNTGGTTQQEGFSVTLVRADHSAGMGEAGVTVPLGLPNGALLRAPGEPTVYHMGDTDIFGDMALIQEIYAPDVLMVPVGDRFTMGAQTAALAVKKYFKPKAVFPCHYGSFPIIDPTADKFVAAMEGSGVQVIVPQKATAVTVA